jgi:hypothetical protein
MIGDADDLNAVLDAGVDDGGVVFVFRLVRRVLGM